MVDQTTSSGWSIHTKDREFWRDITHLAVLWGFTVAQPLFDLISRHGEFLVAHRVTPGYLILLAVDLSLTGPLLLAALLWLARVIQQPLYSRAHFSLTTLLASGFILTCLRRLPEMPGPTLILLALFSGFYVALLRQRLISVRSFLSILAPSVLIFPTWFLIWPPVSGILIQESNFRLIPVELPAKPPIVIAVFDQLPLTSLLNDERKIDAENFPHFASLATDSLWFRNTTTVSDLTGFALPAIVTGKYPVPGLLPTAEDYPESLFSWLGAAYHFRVYEPITTLCPEELSERETLSFVARSSDLLEDLGWVYLHLLLPRDLSHPLPPITQKWKNFAAEQARGWQEGWIKERDQDRWLSTADFISSIATDDPENTVYFLHSLLPHEPYLYLPSGRHYGPVEELTGLLRGEVWADNEVAVATSYQRHLLQLTAVDLLLGQLIDRLRKQGLYERCLLVVTSDHGASFRPGDHFKTPTPTNLHEIMPVPFLLKLPDQYITGVSDRNVETVDILPTLADALGIQLPWAVDGQSAMESDRPERQNKTIFFGGARKQLKTLPSGQPERQHETIGRRLRLFGGTGLHASSLGAYSRLIRTQISENTVTEDGQIRVQLCDPLLFRKVRLTGTFSPALITGWIVSSSNETDPIDLAISVNGKIAATTQTYGMGIPGRSPGSWSALIPEEAFLPDVNAVEVLAVSGSPERPLSRIIHQRRKKRLTEPGFTTKDAVTGCWEVCAAEIGRWEVKNGVFGTQHSRRQLRNRVFGPSWAAKWGEVCPRRARRSLAQGMRS